MYDSWLVFTFHDWSFFNVTQGIGQFKLGKGIVIWNHFNCKGFFSFPCSGRLSWCPGMHLIVSLMESIFILCVSIALSITLIFCFTIVLCVYNYYWQKLSLNFLSSIIFGLCVLVLHLFCNIIFGLCALLLFFIFSIFFWFATCFFIIGNEVWWEFQFGDTQEWWGWVVDGLQLLEINSTMLKWGMFRWWHEVCGREKGKTMLSFLWFLFWYTLEEWAQKVVEIDELLKV